MNFSRLASPANPSGALRRRALATARVIPPPCHAMLRLAGVVLGMSSLSATAASANLKWNANPETDIASYRVSYGTSAGSHPTTINAGLATRTTITGLADGTKYYFVLTAISTSGQESETSDEISYQVPATTPLNQAPVADAKSVTTAEDTAASVVLTATDADANPLTYAIVSGPAKGTLSGTAPNLTYTPAADVSGADSFTYKANDGSVDSNTATVSITINPVNDAPVANAKSVTTSEDTPVSITLSGSDKEGNSLSYSIVAQPAKGTLTGTAPNLSYTPAADVNGADSFTYKANDGSADSYTATVSITINAVNDAPVAAAKSVTTQENTPVSITLAGSDKEGNTLTYSVITAPSNGTLTGTAPNLTYMPAKNFSGADSFTYRANDGSANSNTAAVSINVTKNPVLDDTDVLARSGWTLKFVDSEDAADYPAVDAFDGNPDTFWHTRWRSGATPPPHEIQIDLGKPCSLHGFRYLPRQDGFKVGNIGQYEFYTSLDGTNWGEPVATGTFANNTSEKEVLFATTTARYVRLRSLAEANGDMHTAVAELDLLGTAVPNHAPVAASQSAETSEETALPITLAGSDEDNDALTFSIITPPAHGTLTGTAPDVTYTPTAGFSGVDSLTYQVHDGTAPSGEATISITVTPKEITSINNPPVFAANPLVLPSGVEGKPYSAAAVSVSDPDAGDVIMITKVSGPAWLDVSSSGKPTGTPPAGSADIHRFTIRATDQAGAFAEAELVIEVSAADLPLPWDFARIGGSPLKSTAAFQSATFTLEGAGNLTGTADAGAFVWQTLGGDFEIIVRVADLADAERTARAGLMIRDSLAANSKHIFLGVNGGGDFRWVRRARTGGDAVMKPVGSGAIPKAWLRLVRKGGTIIASKSANGSDWTRVASTPADFGTNCHVGLFLSSGDQGTAAASFRSLKLKP